MKIALTGSSGTGRTTIAQKLAQVVDYPALTNLTKNILRDDGFKYGTNFTVEEFLSTPERQKKLFENKKIMESHYEDFVTDRSWLDLASYCIQGMYNSSYSDFDIDNFVLNCQNEIKKYDIVIHIPWGRQPLKFNGTRTINPWFQLIIDSIVYKLAIVWKVNIISVPVDLNNDLALEWIIDYLKKNKFDLNFNKESS